MDFFQTFILALVQGVTELFPVSSVAHGVLTPYIFQWNLDLNFLKEQFLPFMVMLHLGTAIALLLFFGSEWSGIIKSLVKKEEKYRQLLYLIVVGSIPAALIGLLFEKHLRMFFSNITSAAFFLIINGFLLYVGEKNMKRGDLSIRDLSYKQAFFIGAFQSLALIPGFSRSGATITAGFFAGLKHSESVRFSMLLATPIILGATILEFPKVLNAGFGDLWKISLFGGFVSAIAAFLSVFFMMKWFNKNEITAMRPFAIYCWIVGGTILFFQFL